jgi:hypothetical protein
VVDFSVGHSSITRGVENREKIVFFSNQDFSTDNVNKKKLVEKIIMGSSLKSFSTHFHPL